MKTEIDEPNWFQIGHDIDLHGGQRDAEVVIWFFILIGGAYIWGTMFRASLYGASIHELTYTSIYEAPIKRNRCVAYQH